MSWRVTVCYTPTTIFTLFHSIYIHIKVIKLYLDVRVICLKKIKVDWNIVALKELDPSLHFLHYAFSAFGNSFVWMCRFKCEALFQWRSHARERCCRRCNCRWIVWRIAHRVRYYASDVLRLPLRWLGVSARNSSFCNSRLIGWNGWVHDERVRAPASLLSLFALSCLTSSSLRPLLSFLLVLRYAFSLEAESVRVVIVVSNAAETRHYAVRSGNHFDVVYS